jgi:hypothetical protein
LVEQREVIARAGAWIELVAEDGNGDYRVILRGAVNSSACRKRNHSITLSIEEGERTSGSIAWF